MDSDNNKRKFEDSEDFGLEKKKKATDKPDEVLPNITVAMECPVEKVGAVIGKKGANVNEIMKRSGCKIAIDQSDHRDGAPRKINLTGPPDKLAVAMQLVSKLMKDGANALLEGGAKATSEEKGSANSEKSATLESESMCPKGKVGEVIGVRGTTVAEIMRRSGCRIHIIQETSGEAQERKVVYNGTAAQMAEAKALVQSVINDGAAILGLGETSKSGKNSAAFAVPLSVEDTVEPEKVGGIIGTKGHCINEIIKRSGCKVVINQDFPKGEPHRIVYSGQSEQIETARAMVQMIVEKGPQALADYGSTPDVQEMDIFQKHTGRVLGPQGCVIKEMQARFQVKLNITVSPEARSGGEGAVNKMKITGTIDTVGNAKACINHIISGGTLESFPAPMNMNNNNNSNRQTQQNGPNNGGNSSQYGGNNNSNGNNNQQYNQQQQFNNNNGYNDNNNYNNGNQNNQNYQQQNASQFYPPSVTASGYGQSQGQGQGQNNNQNYSQNNQHQQGNYNSNQNSNQNNYQQPHNNNNSNNNYQSAPTSSPAPTASGASLGLGADGTSGILDPFVVQPDGSHSQVANVRNEVLGKIIGRAGSNLLLIKSKSGASVIVAQQKTADGKVVDSGGYTKVTMVGAPPDVYLATQMIQEILVNGANKLSSLPDKTLSSTGGSGGGSYKASSSNSNSNNNPAFSGNSNSYNESYRGSGGGGGSQYSTQNSGSQGQSQFSAPTSNQGGQGGGAQQQFNGGYPPYQQQSR